MPDMILVPTKQIRNLREAWHKDEKFIITEMGPPYDGIEVSRKDLPIGVYRIKVDGAIVSVEKNE